jgi:hypothetical protein
MAVKNNYIAQREADRQKFFVAGCDTAAQQMFDMLCLVLTNPEVMTKYRVVKADQLKKIHDAMFQEERKYHEAWMNTQESDYYQEKLDANLREIFKIVPSFQERYPFFRDWDYNKPYRGK